MRLSTAITELSELLQRANSTEWSEKELGSHLHRHIESLSRKMALLDSGYFNHTLRLLATSARQVHTGIWEYTLPTWITRIVDVRRLTDTTTPTNAGLGEAIPRVTKYESRGWRWNGPTAFQLKGFGSAYDLEITVAKRPARLTKGTLPTQANLTAPNTSYVRLDADTSADALIHPHESVQGSYANAIIEVTGQTARSGQIQRVIGSTHFVNEAGTLYTVLQVEPGWTSQPLAGDTYDLHMEIPEEHYQCPLLLAAYTLWGTRGNTDEQKAMSASVQEAMNEFVQHITPRDVQMPYQLRYSILPPFSGQGAATEDTRRPLWT